MIRSGRYQILLATCVAMSVLLLGCPVGTGGISGLVVDDETGEPVAAASVATVPETFSDTTSVSGAFSIDYVDAGTYTVVVTATGYAPQQVTDVSVVAGSDSNVEVRLTESSGSPGTVSGVVRKHDRPADTVLSGATVALVDAAALAATASRTPLETLAAASPYQAETGADGAYAIDGVLPGSYYIHATPGAADEPTVLPGGDVSRESFVVEAAADSTKDIVLSQQPSPESTYLGSAVCLTCHDGGMASDKTGFKETLHALVYRAPDQVSSIQDLSGYPNANAAHAYFKDGNSRDNTGDGDEFGLRIGKAEFSAFTLPAVENLYDLWLGYETESNRYFVSFSDPEGIVLSQRYYVEFTFGGHGVYKERWITRVKQNGAYDADASGGDSSYYVLPVQYDENMQEGVEPFHPYNFGNWGAPVVEGGPAKTPAMNKSFDLNCAGCHFTGTSLSRDDVGLYHADAVNTSDAAGIIDYDGDGAKDEMVVGCESCHGPGSDHVYGAGAPRLVLSRYLSAERDAMLCGRCHTRGAGKGGFTGVTDHTEYPSKGLDTLLFPNAGVGYEEFAADYHADNPGVYGDTVGHARQHHQQFPDLQKSTHYKNPYLLMGCSDCHELHNRDIGPSLAMSSANNELCLNCHAPYTFGLAEGYGFQAEAEAVSEHMQGNAGMVAGYDPENQSGYAGATATGGAGQCATCHMPKTAASQSRFIHEAVNAQRQPTGGRVRGDISSHVFDVITPAQSQALFYNTATNNQLPNSCGSCHSSITGGIDYSYKSDD